MEITNYNFFSKGVRGGRGSKAPRGELVYLLCILLACFCCFWQGRDLYMVCRSCAWHGAVNG